MAKSFHPGLVRIQEYGTFLGLGRRDFQLGNSTRVLSSSKETDPWVTLRASCLWKTGFQSAQLLDGKHIFLLLSWRRLWVEAREDSTLNSVVLGVGLELPEEASGPQSPQVSLSKC